MSPFTPSVILSESLGPEGLAVTILILLARLALAAVFGLASLTKIVNLKAFRKTVVDFGSPSWAAPPLAFSIPVVELLVAAL